MLAEDGKVAARWSLESSGALRVLAVRAPYCNLGLRCAAVAFEAIFDFWLPLAETPKPM